MKLRDLIFCFNHMYREVSSSLGSSSILILNPLWTSIKTCLSVRFYPLSSSSGLIKLMARPFVPNLPALPTLCKQESRSTGKSKISKTSTIINDEINSFNIDTTTKQVSSNQQSRSVGLEQIIVLDSFLLFEVGMDANWVE